MRRNLFRPPAGWPMAAGVLLTPIRRLRRFARSATAVAAAGFLLLAVSVTGLVEGSNTSLVIMGFDPDRAQLITSLLVCAGAAALAYLCSDRFETAVLLGLLAGTTLYAQTFAQETTSALASRGAAGVFDPGGWLLTLVTLWLSGVAVAWSAATLSRPVRRELVAAGGALSRVARERRAGARSLTRPMMVALTAVLVVVCGSTLADMLNYTPDSHMLAGGPPLQGLEAGPGGTPSAKPSLAVGGNGSSASPTATPTSEQVATASASPSATPSPESAPWLAWKPSGEGQVVIDRLPAPWVGGSTVAVSVYLPPGYMAGGRLYPVVYEPVFSFGQWDRAFNAKSEIDALIDQGTMPAALVVFIDTSGGPYPDSECANSTDGQEWMARFIGETVPTYMDATYRTITKPAARTLLGFSQGGYCAAILTLDYPNVFGNAVSFSGYFHAGVGSTNAWRPFDHSQAVLDKCSPTVVAPQLPAGTRAGLYFVLDYDPAMSFDAQEAESFISVLRQTGYSYTVIKSGQRHSWTQVRLGLGGTLALVGSRQAQEGVFS